MISQQNKNKYEFLTNLRKHKDNTNRTTHGHEYILAKESNSVNSLNKINIGNNMLNSPLNQSKIISSKSIYRNVDLKQAKSFDLYNKLIPIKQQWYSEMNNIISKGYNGYLHKKYKEININNGHIEVENEAGLYLYGNCLKVLSQKMYQDHKKCIKKKLKLYHLIIFVTILL